MNYSFYCLEGCQFFEIGITSYRGDCMMCRPSNKVIKSGTVVRHYDTLRRAHHRFLTRCIGWRKNRRAHHPISYLDTLMKTGGESIVATLHGRWILFAGFVVRMEDARLPKCVWWRARAAWGARKRVDEVCLGRPQSFWHQRRPMSGEL